MSTFVDKYWQLMFYGCIFALVVMLQSGKKSYQLIDECEPMQIAFEASSQANATFATFHILVVLTVLTTPLATIGNHTLIMTDSTKNSWEGIKISDLCLLNPPSKKNTQFKIVVKCGIQKDKTSASVAREGNHENNCVIWIKPLIFAGNITDDTILTFTVRNTRILNITIGSCERRAIDLLKMQSNSGSCKLDVAGKCQLAFSVEKISQLEVASGVIQQASAGLLLNQKAPAEVSNVIESATQVYPDNEKTWTLFIDTFQAFMKVMDGVSEINLYLKVAWSVISIIPKTSLAKQNRDGKVRQLCEKLKDIYEYIVNTEWFHEVTVARSAIPSTNPFTRRLSTTLSALVRQTIECAYFIQAYGSDNIVKNTIKGVGGSVDDKIQDFNDKLDCLKSAIIESVNLKTSIVTLRMLEENTGLTLLNDMPYGGALPLPGKQCLLGTRQTLIDRILTHIHSDTSPQILVLSGQAGIGKSAIAHTIAGIFKEQNRLGSLFCFSRSSPNRRNCLFSTISRDLADGDTFWRTELLKIIPNTAVRRNEDPRTQFEKLIVEPSKSAATIGPVVIVVDALDESGNRNERKEILDILFREWSKLPKNYRIIVTTRPEQDIEAGCQKFNIPCQRMGEIDAEETRHDIQAYVSNYLAPISSVLDKIDRDWDSVLAKRAEGLFQWAQTVCQFIDPTVTRSKLVEKKWKTCVSISSSSLYGLYHQIISSQTECQDTDFIEEFKTIVGAIVTAREPLSIDALQNIFDGIEDIKSILTPFGSFFVGIHDLSTPVRPVHTSLFDFFVSKKIAEEINEYYIDTSLQNPKLTLACLKLMNRMLCFNICQLETSHLRNKEVSNFNSRVEKSIPLHLSYSCRFWGFHLQLSAYSEELVREIRKLMDEKLLYYFEALSLLKAVDRGCVSMREIINWCNVKHNDLTTDAMDAWEFGFEFEDTMTESTPHLYISALPFTPDDSFVRRNYLERYPGLFTFDIGQPVGFLRKIGITHKHVSAGRLTRLAFSPTGKYIATGSDKGEFWVWNYVTGDQLGKEIRPEAWNHWRHGVSDVVFSPDGELIYCCFYGGDILVWHMRTKVTSVERYEGAIGTECHFCTISSDGCFITWCTSKGAFVFDRMRRQVVKIFLKDRFIFTSAAISPNGDWIALYRDPSHDRYLHQPIRVAQFRKRPLPMPPLPREHEVWQDSEVHIWSTRKHTLDVVSRHAEGHLALTDSYLAFVKNRESIEIRDVRENTKVTEIEREIGLSCFHFSPDDQYILLSTSHASEWAYSVRVVSTGELIGRFRAGDKVTQCLGFSHDSQSIALRTHDGTIHVQQWNKSIDIIHADIKGVYEIWLRGAYCILCYWTITYTCRLQISDITTTNTVVFDVSFKAKPYDLPGPVGVFPDEKNVCVAYVASRGLCLWNDKEGESVVDGSVHIQTALMCSEKYLICEHEGVVKIWDSCSRELIHGPINLDLPLANRVLFVNHVLPVRGMGFAVFYNDIVQVWGCESGRKVVQFTAGEGFHETIAFSYKGFYETIAFSPKGKHVICMPMLSVDILNASTGARVAAFHGIRRLSPNRKYLARIYNGKVRLLDTDTLRHPSLNQPGVEKLWFSNDSDFIVTASGAKDTGKRTGFLDIWDIQSKNTIVKTIRYPFKPEKIETLALSNGRLVDSISNSSQSSVWDLDTYETMSTVYNSSPLAEANGSGIEGYAQNHLHIFDLVRRKKHSRKPTPEKTEILDYALMAWKKASLHAFAGIQDNGWVLGLQGELLFWVPEKKRKQFWFPCMMHIPHRDITKLNFTNFVHGSSWTKCRFQND